MEGLCGDFNGNAEDDFDDLAAGLIASTADEFGNLWKTSSSCPDVDTTVSEYAPCEVS